MYRFFLWAMSPLILMKLLIMNNVVCFLWKTRPSKTSMHHVKLFDSISTSVLTKKYHVVKEMPDPLPLILKNSYYLLRHGQSWGNVEGVISSAPTLATNDKHGLTPLGYNQATNSSNFLLDLIIKEEKKPYRVFFYSSPFARARQTAQACLEGLKGADTEICPIHDDLIIHYGLMERWGMNRYHMSIT